MIERSFNEESGIIRVKMVGRWQDAELVDHFLKLRLMIERVREKKLPIRVLVDLRDAEQRSPQIEARITEMKKATYLPGDKVAILTTGISDKFYVRGFLSGVDRWAWQSELAAEQWLSLDKDPVEIPAGRAEAISASRR